MKSVGDNETAAPEQGDLASVQARSCEDVDEAVIATLLEGEVTPSWTTPGLPGTNCGWSNGHVEGVSVGWSPVEEWIQRHPTTFAPDPTRFDAYRELGTFQDPVNAARLDEAEQILASDEGPTPDQACDLFALIMEIPASSSKVVVRTAPDYSSKTIFNDDDKTPNLHAQTCVDGIHYSSLWTNPDLEGTDEESVFLVGVLTQIAESNR